MSSLVLLGAISFTRLNAEMFPLVNFPVANVVTAYPGATPEDVERLVSKPIEDAVVGAANLKYVRTTSLEGYSRVTVSFTEKATGDVAAEVARRVSGVRNQLPPEAGAPTVFKYDSSPQPIVSV